MSARDELPPGRRAVLGAAHRWELYEPRHDAPIRYAKREDAVAMAWRRFGITREEYATMRAAVERCAELEVLADGRSEALDVAIGKINKAEAELVSLNAAWWLAVERCAELEAELAKVAMMIAALSVMRDEARRMAEIRLRAIESIRCASMRATPTEGE